MKKLVLGLCGTLAFGLVAGPASAAFPGQFVQEPTSRNGPDLTVKGHPDMVARFDYLASPRLAAHLNRDGSCTSPSFGLPTWTNSFKDGANSYCYTMVGTNPQTKGTGSTTNLPTVTYAYRLTFSNGQVFDPTVVNSKCDTVSPYQRLQESPLYTAAPITSNGVNLGTIQYEDAQSVGEWYKFVKAKKGYGITLQDSGTPTVINVTVPAADGKVVSTSSCNGSIGEVDINWLANQLDTNNAWSANTIPVVLLTDVFQTESGSCCVLGYHGTFTDSKNQNGAFSVTAMSDAGIFNVPIEDIHATSHEFGELINDPSGNNTVPTWGHVGQQSGCQTNLEVGDPLTGIVFNGSGITAGGYTYHPQELVYFSWFTQTTKPYGKYGTGDKYSMSGTFTSPAKFC